MWIKSADLGDWDEDQKKNIIQLWDTIATPKEWLKT